MSDLGTLSEHPDGWELRFQRHLHHPIDAVWAAITDGDQVAQWWGTHEEADLRAGGRLVIKWANEGGPTMTAAITAWDPPHVLELVGDIHGRLRWELSPDGEGTLLRFTNVVAEAPDGEFEGRRIGFPENLAGWHWHLAALADVLADKPVDLSMDDWETYRNRYAEALA
jgi:uncharacterized protein YndB with AHSA1/START domain